MINSTFEVRNADAGLNVKLLQIVFNIHRLILTLYDLITKGEIDVKTVPVRKSTNIHDIALNGTK